MHQLTHSQVPRPHNAPCCAQDFFQVLKPGLQLLRPPKKDAKDGAGIVAGFVGYNYDAFKGEFGIEPWQVVSFPAVYGSCLALPCCIHSGTFSARTGPRSWHLLPLVTAHN